MTEPLEEQTALFDVGKPAPPLFDSVLVKPDPKPRPEPDRTEPMKFYDPPISGATISPDGLYRYRLWRIFKSDGPTLLVIGANPSRANHEVDDNTLRQAMFFARREGYAKVFLGNVFAYRTPYPKDLRKAHESGVDIVGPENYLHLIAMMEESRAVLMAYGNLGAYLKRDEHLKFNLMDRARSALNPPDIPFYCIGKTKSNYPRHLLYARHDSKFMPFEYEPSVSFEEPL